MHYEGKCNQLIISQPRINLSPFSGVIIFSLFQYTLFFWCSKLLTGCKEQSKIKQIKQNKHVTVLYVYDWRKISVNICWIYNWHACRNWVHNKKSTQQNKQQKIYKNIHLNCILDIDLYLFSQHTPMVLQNKIYT